MSDPTPWIVADDIGAARKHAPATLRNREPIAEQLASILPDAGCALEVASGSGEHCAFLAGRFPALAWQPSDPEPAARISIGSWCSGLANVAAPLDLDAAAHDWPIGRADAVLCVNMVHISPWEATLGLMAGAARLLAAGQPLILYGPFTQSDVATAASNLAFDATLRTRDSRWGIRSVDAVTAAASASGLHFERSSEMPANNLMLVYRRA